MKRVMKGGLFLASFLACISGPAQLSNRVTYTLLDGSYFLDACLVCGRPDILQPMQGTFDLVLLQDTAPYSRYAVENVNFTASPGTVLERRLAGSGIYTRFEEFAIVQSMYLDLQVKDPYTNRQASFTNNTAVVERPFPLIGADLTQSNGTLLQTFSLRLLGAPVREIWFSTRHGFTSTNRWAPTNQISDGALLSNHGRVVKRNIDLTYRLGIMPIVPDLGLDAVQVTKKGEVLFSLPGPVFSETLGPLQEGDVLSSQGVIFKRNQQLLAAFKPLSTNDAGLDALQLLPSGEILFSITTNVQVSGGATLHRGDILSDQGRVYLTQQQLLAKFHPSATGQDFGLDALYAFPSGEIWFSVQQGFTDSQLGEVREGDLLSNLGYRVFSNQALIAAFGPADPSLDYGLDSLFVVTDTQVSSAAPQLLYCARSGNVLRLVWDGEGAVFQVQTAPGLAGPWSAPGPIVPDLSSELPLDSGTGAAFFRVQQW